MKKTTFFSLLFLSLSTVFSQTPVKIMDGEINYLFNERLSEREILNLRNGEVVCNSIRKIKFARINQIPETEQLISSVEEVNPNHLAEIIKILPYSKYENITETVATMLKDEESYTKVPFSRNDDGSIRYLYSFARIENIENDNENEIITEKFCMPPLDYFTGKISSERFGNYFFYKMQNINKIRYKIFSAVGKKKMIAVISIFRYGDNWIIYALGGVDIIRLPFIDNAIDRAFYNRIKTFCLFTFERLEEFGSVDEGN
ncbi:MAG: hypothetical protein IJ257_06785 [Treponema sp.]|nr:hypothetical protein [Treponema sp.]